MSSHYKVTQRPGSRNWQVRYYVPQEYRPALGGTSEIWRSLRTPDHRKAQEIAGGVAQDIWHDILAAQPPEWIAASGTVLEPTDAQMEDAARQVYDLEVENDIDERSDAEEARLLERGGKEAAKANKREARRLREAVAVGDFSVADIDYWSHHFGFQFRSGSPRQNRFRQMLARAHAEALQRFSEHDKGKFGRKPADPLFRHSTARSEAPAIAPVEETFKQPPLLDHWSMYVRQKCGNLKGDTISNRFRVVTLFAEFVGIERPTDSITKDDCRNFRDLLYKLPAKASTRHEFAGMSFPETIRANERLGHQTISPNRIKHYISDLSAYFGWLAIEERATDNLWKGLAPDVVDNSRIPFSAHQLQKLFSSPLFCGCAGDKDIRQFTSPGKTLVRDWRFWLPLMAAFSGARLGELAQLELSDIKTIDGVACFEITNAGSDPAKSVKTGAAVRTVPIHSRLIALGFLEFIAQQRKRGATRLFPDLVRNKKGQYDKPAKFYARYFQRMGFAPDREGKRPTFHSFRHSVIDEFRRGNLAEHEFQPIVGHEIRSVTRGYGKVETYSPSRRKEMIENIRYLGLDLAKIRSFGGTRFS